MAKKKDKVDWIQDSEKKEQDTRERCYQELQKIVTNTMTECYEQDYKQDATVDELLIQMGWAFTRIEAEVTQQ